MSIFDKYDLVEVDGDIIIPEKPKCGKTLIVGSSGTGKTTILKKWGMQELEPVTGVVIDQFSSPEEGERFLIAAGLRSIPTWRREISNLSNGERHRAEIAIALSRGDNFIDEFTSLVDRNTARALCVSINKLKLKNIVLATCHKDVVAWLDADNVYDTDLSEWVNRGSLQRSSIDIEIVPADTQKIWRVFKKHHYLSGQINKAATSWAALYLGKPIAMVSILAFPNANFKNAWREHRTVVLPEFQGMGIGTSISDTIAEHVVSTGNRFFSKTAHPAFGLHREKSNLWKATSKNKKQRLDYSSKHNTKEDGHKFKHANRFCYSHEYVGNR